MRKYIEKIYLGIMLFFMYAPILVLMVFSFNSSRTRGHWGGFTLNWYYELFNDEKILMSLYTTILIAFLSSIISTAIGTFAALGLNNMKKRTRTVVMNITNLPALNPDIVTGVSLMILFTTMFNIIGKGDLGFATLLISHIVFNIPYVVLSVLPKIRQMDKSLYEAALDLGADPFTAFWKVVFPEILPGIITGAIFAFTLSIDDFIISFFTTGSGVNNLSVMIYSMTRRGINPKINAVSTLMFITVLALMYLINRRDANKLKES